MSDLYKPQTLKLYAQQAGSVRLTLDWFANKAFYPRARVCTSSR